MIDKSIKEKLTYELNKLSYYIDNIIVIDGNMKILIKDKNDIYSKPVIIQHDIDSKNNINILINSVCSYKADEKEKYGLTHLTEHCLFHNVKIDEYLNLNELDGYAKTYGLEINAFTLSNNMCLEINYTPYNFKFKNITSEVLEYYPELHELVDKDFSKSELIAISNIFNGIIYENNITQKSFDKELGIVLSEVHNHENNYNYNLQDITLNIFSKPYNHVGTRDNIKNFTLKDVLETQNLFRKNINSSLITLDLNIIDINYLVNLIDILSKLLNKSKDKVDYSVYEKDSIGDRTELFNKYDKINYLKTDNNIHRPIISVGWDIETIFKLAGIKKKQIYSTKLFLNLYLFNGMHSYFNSIIREEYGRCYYILSLSYEKEYYATNNGEKNLLGFSFYCDGNDIEIDGSKFTKIGEERILKEITDTIDNIFITKDIFLLVSKNLKDIMINNINKSDNTKHLFVSHCLGIDNINKALEDYKYFGYEIDFDSIQKVLKLMSNTYKIFITYK